MTRTIAIIGGGVSGTLAAVHLLNRAMRDDLRVVLVNRSGWQARGVAYGTRNEAHVLNVPAGRMSAFADDEEHFLRFARSRDPAIEGGTFAPRKLYGEYLAHLLQDARARVSDAHRYAQIVGHVGDIALTSPHTARVALADGTMIAADKVILALGNFAPADPQLADANFFHTSSRYIRDPWQPDALDRADLLRPVLLIGTGLTMVDIALDLRMRGHAGPLHALSRRGLLPQPHRSLDARPLQVDLPRELFAGAPSIRTWTRLIRQQVAQLATHGVDWRDTLATLRSATPALWQKLSVRERARFLRHLQPYWEVHRHRLAPPLASRLRELLDERTLTVAAGRIQGLEHAESEVRVTYRPRGSDQSTQLNVGTVINCTGPNTHLNRLHEPLIATLAARGILTPDPLDLGILVAENYGVVQRDGSVSEVIHYIGPLLKAQFWESTAVPELRVHAAALVRQLRV